MDILKKVRKYILENHLIEIGDKVLIGFSGGPDSVFLFEILTQLKEEFEIQLALVHINHLLRGEDSAGDEQFCLDLAAEKGIPCYVKRVNVKEYSKAKGIGEEEAGREIRYDFFKESAQKWGASKVALAHNKDDQIETFLFRMMRGSSLKGLQGIPVQRGIFVRPVLDIYKEEILDYLLNGKVVYRTDSTNFENIYTRNSIRLDLIPFIEKRYNVSFKEKIFNLMEEIKEANEILEVDYKKFLKNGKIKINEIENLQEYEKKKVISGYLNSKDVEVSREKIDNVLLLLGKGGTKRVSLGRNIELKKEYHEISVELKRPYEKPQKQKSESLTLKIPGSVKFGKYKIKAFETQNISSGKREFCTSLKDGDILVVRKKIPGDRICPVGMDSSKKLKDIFINDKVSRDIREEIPVITFEDEILWVAGLRGSEEFKAGSTEKKVIKLIVEEENFSE